MCRYVKSKCEEESSIATMLLLVNKLFEKTQFFLEKLIMETKGIKINFTDASQKKEKTSEFKYEMFAALLANLCTWSGHCLTLWTSLFPFHKSLPLKVIGRRLWTYGR